MSWPENYDAELSMQNAMGVAEDIMKTWRTENVPSEIARTQMHNVDTWTQIAQVHAINLQNQLLLRIAAALELATDHEC